LESLSKIVDQLVVGGGIANTFIAAQGHNVGKSLCEDDLIPSELAIAIATVLVPPSNWSNSNTPTGPFHTIVPAFFIIIRFFFI
jgi:hypothetical protein